jgi:hypothetical protein
MIIELKGEKFPLRASMLAIQEAEDKEKLQLHALDGIVDTSKMLYYFAKHGAREAGDKWTMTMSAWLDMIELNQVTYLTTVLNGLVGGEDDAEGKKKD